MRATLRFYLMHIPIKLNEDIMNSVYKIVNYTTYALNTLKQKKNTESNRNCTRHIVLTMTFHEDIPNGNRVMGCTRILVKNNNQRGNKCNLDAKKRGATILEHDTLSFPNSHFY